MDNERMASKRDIARTGARPEPFSGEAQGARGGDAGYLTAEDIRREAALQAGGDSATRRGKTSQVEGGSDAEAR
ncbi:MAG TPA: hypothetical protein V6D05_14140 [Stenomitos sp.]